MTHRLIELLELTSTFVLDIDAENRLLVRSDETGSHQLYEIGSDGEKRQLTDFGQPATGRYLPGRRSVVASVDDSGTERTQLWLIDLEPEVDTRVSAEPQPLVVEPDAIHTLHAVLADRVVYSTNRRNGVDFEVISRAFADGSETVVYDGGGWFTEVAVSSDGRWTALTRMTLVAASSEVLLVGTDGTAEVITDPQAAGEWRNLRWLPDSQALLASSDSDAEYHSVRLFDLASQRWSIVHEVAETDVLAWPSPDGHWWAVVTRQDGADEIALHPVGAAGWLVPPGSATSAQPAGFEGVESAGFVGVESGGFEGVEPGQRSVLLTLPDVGVVTHLSEVVFAPDSSQLAITFASPTNPPEVYLWTDTAGLQRRTQSNSLAASLELPSASSHRIPAPDGEVIPALTLTPGEPDGSAVLILHGGPESASVRCWNPVASALALAGHTVVLPNIRGSAGYGRRWMSLDDGPKRVESLLDLKAVHTWLADLGVDQNRVALYGGSYGGYLVLAGLSFFPELWAAGVDIVGMSSLVTFLENTSGYRRAYREREYGTLEHDREALQAASPLTRIGSVRAPLFIIHGANDPRVPLSEAEQVAAAVRANEADCHLLVYADEGHGLAKRANRIDAYPQVLSFLAAQLS